MARGPLLADALGAESLKTVWDLETGDLVAVQARRSESAADAYSRALDLAQRLGLTTPRSLIVEAPNALGTFLAGAPAPTSRTFVLGITDAELGHDPVTTLRTVRTLRERGWAIAIDTPVWGTPTLALLPLLNPDVIMIDLRKLDEMPLEHADDVLNTVGAHTENADCVILALGIASESDIDRARAFGATLGQGEMLNRKRPLIDGLPRLEGIKVRPPQTTTERLRDTPFTVVAERRESRAGSRQPLHEISTLLERRAGLAGSSAVVLSTFQHARNLSDKTRRRYDGLGHTAAMVAIFAPGLYGGATRTAFTKIHVDDDDVLNLEWTVIVLSPTFAAVLTAKQTGRSADGNAVFEFIFSRNHRLAIEAARTLTARL